MEKQTKNVLNREFIENELRFKNSATLRFSLVLCGVLSLVFIPLTIVVLYGILSVINNIWLKMLLAIPSGGVFIAPVCLAVAAVREAMKERKLLARGDFDIVTRDVQYKDERMVHRHMEKFLHFSGFDEVNVGSTVFDLASNGDEFYIVHYKGGATVRLLYSFKMYEFKEK